MEKVYLLSATLLLACCASPQTMDVANAGRLPKPGGHNLQVSSSADGPLTDRVLAALTSQGFKVAEPADYFVQIASSDIPGKTGLFLPDTGVDASGNRTWLTAPSRSKGIQTRSITITLTDIATGKEVYRAFGDERYRAGQLVGSDALLDAVVGQIAQPNAVSPDTGPEEAAT